MKSVLAIDQGTTGSTALILGDDGSIRSRAYREFTQHFPQPGWVEHDPVEIWNVTLEVAREAVVAAGDVPTTIGITNQRETLVAWDRRTGEPVHRAIVWQDRRTTDRCRELQAEMGGEYLTRKTGLRWDPYFTATKIEWLMRHDPDVARHAAAGDVLFGTVDSWLIWKLSGGETHVTDHTNASRTMLYDLDSMSWDPELLEVFDVPSEALPTIVGSAGPIAAAKKDLFGVEIPVAGVAGDQQAALYGQACWQPGQAKCTYGTGAFLLHPLGDEKGVRAGSGMLTTIACHADGSPTLAVEGSIFIAGAALQWLRDGLGLVEDAEQSAAMAARLEDNGGVFLVPAFVGLGAPHWEADARGTIVGLTRGSTAEHLVRAALEAMAYGTKDLVDAVVGSDRLVELRVDGGAAANNWLMQFLADTLETPVMRPDIVETTALGAAGLAGVATGVWGSPEEFASARDYQYFQPGATNRIDHGGWKRAVGAAIAWANGGNIKEML